MTTSYAGLDWASQTHAVCILDEHCTVREQFEAEHNAACIWPTGCAACSNRSGPAPAASCSRTIDASAGASGSAGLSTQRHGHHAPGLAGARSCAPSTPSAGRG